MPTFRWHPDDDENGAALDRIRRTRQRADKITDMTATKQEILEAAIARSNAISQQIPHGDDYADRFLEEAGVTLDERTKALLDLAAMAEALVAKVREL